MEKYRSNLFLDLLFEKPEFIVELLGETLGATLPWGTHGRPRADNTNPSRWSLATPTLDQVIVFDDPNDPDEEGYPPPPLGAVLVDSLVQVFPGDRPRRNFRWPVDVASVRAEHGCPTVLVILCTDPRLAEWAAQPMPVGQPGFVLQPYVIGPNDVPPIRDPERAAALPELAVVSAVMHKQDTDRCTEILRALITGLGPKLWTDGGERSRYQGYLAALYLALPDGPAQVLKQFGSDAHRPPLGSLMRRLTDAQRAQGQILGRIDGQARSIVRVLEGRGVDVPDQIGDTIRSCTDGETLEGWLLRAGTVDSAEELLGSGLPQSA